MKIKEEVEYCKRNNFLFKESSSPLSFSLLNFPSLSLFYPLFLSSFSVLFFCPPLFSLVFHLFTSLLFSRSFHNVHKELIGSQYSGINENKKYIKKWHKT